MLAVFTQLYSLITYGKWTKLWFEENMLITPHTVGFVPV